MTAPNFLRRRRLARSLLILEQLECFEQFFWRRSFIRIASFSHICQRHLLRTNILLHLLLKSLIGLQEGAAFARLCRIWTGSWRSFDENSWRRRLHLRWGRNVLGQVDVHEGSLGRWRGGTVLIFRSHSQNGFFGRNYASTARIIQLLGHTCHFLVSEWQVWLVHLLELLG